MRQARDSVGRKYFLAVNGDFENSRPHGTIGTMRRQIRLAIRWRQRPIPLDGTLHKRVPRRLAAVDVRLFSETRRGAAYKAFRETTPQVFRTMRNHADRILEQGARVLPNDKQATFHNIVCCGKRKSNILGRR